MSVEIVPQEIAEKIRTARAVGLHIILVTGVFDLLHEEHIKFLQKAKDLGGFLVVAIEADVRVRQIKGEGRPINSSAVRVQELVATKIPDVVFVLPEQFGQREHHRQLLEEIHPNVLAVSSHTAHLDKKQALMAEIDGEVVVVHQHNPNISTTQLLAQKMPENITGAKDAA